MSNENRNGITYIFTVTLERHGFDRIKDIHVDSFYKVEVSDVISIDKLFKLSKLFNNDFKKAADSVGVSYDVIEQDIRNVKGIFVRKQYTENTEGPFAVISQTELSRDMLSNLLKAKLKTNEINEFLEQSYI